MKKSFSFICDKWFRLSWYTKPLHVVRSCKTVFLTLGQNNNNKKYYQKILRLYVISKWMENKWLSSFFLKKSVFCIYLMKNCPEFHNERTDMRMIERVSEYNGKDLNPCMFEYSIFFVAVVLCNLLWITDLYLISFCFYYFVTMTCCSNSANSYGQFLWYESFRFNVQLRRSYAVILVTPPWIPILLWI